MPGISGEFARTVARVDERCKPECDVEERALARCPEVRHGGLDQVPGAIKLVGIAQVRPFLVGSGDLVPCVQIPVRLLGGPDLGDDGIDACFELGIGVGREGERHALEHLVQVRIGEQQPLVALVGARGGEVEVHKVASLLEHRQAVVHGGGAVGLLPGRPEPVLDRHRGKRHGLKGHGGLVGEHHERDNGNRHQRPPIPRIAD